MLVCGSTYLSLSSYVAERKGVWGLRSKFFINKFAVQQTLGRECVLVLVETAANDVFRVAGHGSRHMTFK